MPQVWLTYQELGEFLGCNEAAARDKCISSGWRRRGCSDGLTRAKLTPAMAHDYMTAYATTVQGSGAADQLVASLRNVLEQAQETRARPSLKHVVW
jgi:hypothetical protein